jgi:hypothetical protein
MASFGHTFDASTVEPTTPFEVFPPGKYRVQTRRQRNAPDQGRPGAIPAPRTRRARRTVRRAQALRPPQPRQRQPRCRADGTAHPVGPVPRRRQDAGQQQRTTAPDPDPGRRQGAPTQGAVRREQLDPLPRRAAMRASVIACARPCGHGWPGPCGKPCGHRARSPGSVRSDAMPAPDLPSLARHARPPVASAWSSCRARSPRSRRRSPRPTSPARRGAARSIPSPSIGPGRRCVLQAAGGRPGVGATRRAGGRPPLAIASRTR